MWQQLGGLIIDGGVFCKARLQQQISGVAAPPYEAVPDGPQRPPAGSGEERVNEEVEEEEPAAGAGDKAAGSGEDLSD